MCVCVCVCDRLNESGVCVSSQVTFIYIAPLTIQL